MNPPRVGISRECGSVTLRTGPRPSPSPLPFLPLPRPLALLVLALLVLVLAGWAWPAAPAAASAFFSFPAAFPTRQRSLHCLGTQLLSPVPVAASLTALRPSP